MGRNYYLNTVVTFGATIKQSRTIKEECHVGRNDWLDIIDICRFFRIILECFEDVEHYDKYLKRVEKAVNSKRNNKNCQRVFNNEFDNLPQMIVEIYNFFKTQKYPLVAEDEYEQVYNFKDHIQTYCINPNQKEFGGLRYSTNTQFF